MEDVISRTEDDYAYCAECDHVEMCRWYPMYGCEFKSRPSAQPELDEWCTDCKEYDKEKHSCPRWNRVIRNTLKDAQPEPHWIPCSEKLPESDGFYLVTVCAEYRPVRIYCFSPYGMHEDKKYWMNDCDCHSYVFNHFVEAWLPLPEPYGGEQDD